MQLALMALPLIGAVGLAIDGGRAFLTRYEMASALDAAALALGSTKGMARADLEKMAALYVEQNLRTLGASTTLTILPAGDAVVNANTVTVTGQVDMPTMFMQLWGQSKVNIAATSQISRGGNDLELALVLDTTGSMAGTRISTLQTAAKNLIDTVINDTQTPYYSKAALVPFSNSVNLTPAMADAARGALTATATITAMSWKKGSQSTITNAAWCNGGTLNVTAIPKSANTTVTYSGTSFTPATGDYIVITGVSGMTQVNNTIFKAGTVNTTAKTIVLLNKTTGAAISSTGWSTYSSGGTIGRCLNANCEVQVTTSAAHGLSDGSFVYVTGVGGMTSINNTAGTSGTVTGATGTAFFLSGTFGPSYSAYTSGGTAQGCYTAACEVQVTTAAAHPFANGAGVFIQSVSGMTQANNRLYSGGTAATNWTASNVTTSTFIATGLIGPSSSNYTSGGTADCIVQGCKYYAFNNAQDGKNTILKWSTCVSERTGLQAFTDAAPSIAPVGLMYQNTASNACPNAETMIPLTSNKTTLKAGVDALVASGSTAGHLGFAWGWYSISSNWASYFAAGSQPAAKNDHLQKVMVLMTDGAFNTAYCGPVISADSNNGAGSAADHRNCNATNGTSFAQAKTLCANIKAQGITLYTVGFDLAVDAAALDMLQTCASDGSHFYNAPTQADLTAAFNSIATSITLLRLTR